MTSDPAAVSWGNSGSAHGVRLDVLWVASDTQLGHAYSDNGSTFNLNTWSQPIFGATNYAYRPAVVSPRPYRLDVFQAQRVFSFSSGATHPLTHSSWANGAFSDWQYWQPSATGNWNVGGGPGAVSWTLNGLSRVDVFYLNTDSPPKLAHVYSLDGGVSLAGGDFWPLPPGTIVGDVSAAMFGEGQFDVYVLDANGTLWDGYFNNGLSWAATSAYWSVGSGAANMGDWRETLAGRYPSDNFLSTLDFDWTGWVETFPGGQNGNPLGSPAVSSY
jgi:hypothetical protein